MMYLPFKIESKFRNESHKMYYPYPVPRCFAENNSHHWIPCVFRLVCEIFPVNKFSQHAVISLVTGFPLTKFPNQGNGPIFASPLPV